MDIKVGDIVQVIKNDHMIYHVKVGDRFTVIDVTSYGKVIMKNDRCTQTTYLPDGEIAKIVEKTPKSKYIEPEYISEFKRQAQSLSKKLRFHKYINKIHHRSGTYKSTVSKEFLTLKREAHLIHMILKQHNQLKKLHARIND